MAKIQIFRLIVIVVAVGVAVYTGHGFLGMHINEPIYPGDCEILRLSDYFEPLRGTAGDTDIYLFNGADSGASVLVLGGTHPNEPASMVAATCLIENISVKTGRFFLFARANNSGFTHNDPQEGNPRRFPIKTASGERWFRYGSRYTNPIDQWPDPDVYKHYPSGQRLSAAETRNLNRSYPGRSDGNLTEQIAYAIMQVLETENIDLTVDLHEASLEYPVINAVVAHQLAFDIGAEAVMYMQMEGILFNLEPSPEEFRGLSHREWGDWLGIPALLMESTNPMQGRYHGRVSPEVVVTGKDKYNLEAARSGLLEVDYPDDGLPIDLRVGRHIKGLATIFDVWNNWSDEKIIIENMPEYSAILENGVGAYLK